MITKQVENLCMVKAIPQYPCSDVMRLTGPIMMSKLAKQIGLKSLPLASRWKVVYGSGPCAAKLVQHNGQCWAELLRVKHPFFKVFHAASWCNQPGVPRYEVAATKVTKTIHINFSKWNHGRGLQPLKRPAASMVPVTAAMHAIQNAPLQQQLDLMLRSNTGNLFPASEFGRITKVAELPPSPERNAQRRPSVVSILVSDIPECRQQHTC